MNLPPARKAKAELFRALHAGDKLLILPNAWDAVSARIFEEAGFPAIGTTSAGIAYAHGYADRERIPRSEMADAVRRIAESVKVPVSADMEAGYGGRASDVAETVAAVLDGGAVGINLEDATHETKRPLFDPAVQVDRIRAARETAEKAGVPIVINARIDVFLAGSGSEKAKMDETASRANAYRDAGADCVFVPGVSDPEQIQALVKRIRGPLNILAGPKAPSAKMLQKLGVKRLSLGSGPIRAAMGLMRRISKELRGAGTYDALTHGAISYADMNELLSRRPE
jgi:2-methylisocitrate lyase-like PEP mutase family enzyme